GRAPAGGCSRTLPFASTVGSPMLTPCWRMHLVNCRACCSWFAVADGVLLALPLSPLTEATPDEPLDPHPPASKTTIPSRAAKMTGPARPRARWNGFLTDMASSNGRRWAPGRRSPALALVPPNVGAERERSLKRP